METAEVTSGNTVRRRAKTTDTTTATDKQKRSAQQQTLRGTGRSGAATRVVANI